MSCLCDVLLLLRFELLLLIYSLISLDVLGLHLIICPLLLSGPNLKTLCKLAVIQYSLEQSGLPHDVRSDKQAFTRTLAPPTFDFLTKDTQ